jgi:hypothetical protein
MVPDPSFASNTEYATIDQRVLIRILQQVLRETPATTAFPMRHLDSSTCPVVVRKTKASHGRYRRMLICLFWPRDLGRVIPVRYAWQGKELENR